MNLKKILAASLAATTMLAMAGCNNGPDSEYIKKKGNMVIGYTIINPLNYKDGDKLVGFETEFATAVCEKLGVKPEFVEINWDTKEVELKSKQIDCIWNGMTINPEREANMSITIPYMENRQVMVVKSENAEKYTESTTGASVVAEAGSAGEDLIESDEIFKDASYTAVDSQAKALLDVESGVSDIAVIDYIMAAASTGAGSDYENLVFIDKDFPSENYGIAFRKGSDMTEEVNEAIKELKAEGKLDEIAAKYELQELITAE